MQAIFEPLRASIVAQKFTDIDFLELLGTFATGAPVYAASLAFHARDILKEADSAAQETDYAQLVAESFRRAFFDSAHAERYNTGDMLHVEDPETMLSHFAQHIIVSLGMDEAQVAAGTENLPPSTRQH